MLVAKGHGKKGQPADLVQWLHPAVGDDEERRVAYVGLTRPRKILVLAIPDSTPNELANELEGFAKDEL
jgi:superfamily I DNA/RNA helicase